jgi:hypothetical protein
MTDLAFRLVILTFLFWAVVGLIARGMVIGEDR